MQTLYIQIYKIKKPAALDILWSPTVPLACMAGIPRGRKRVNWHEGIWTCEKKEDM